MSDTWWQTAFGEDYLRLYAHRSDAQAQAEVAALLPRLRQAPGPVLDACCGHGRHLAAMRTAGLEAFGFDYSAVLLQQAVVRPNCVGRLLRADLRTVPLVAGWGAITLLFTSFGYFDDATNAAVLHQLGGLLAPGGLMVLDLPNPVQVAASLRAHTERVLDAASGMRVVEQRSMVGARVEKTITVLAGDGTRRSHRESVRLYGPDEVAALAVQAGLKVEECWPALCGTGHDHDRLVWWLRRPA